MSQTFSDAPQVLDVIWVSKLALGLATPKRRTFSVVVPALEEAPPQPASAPAAPAVAATPIAPLRKERRVRLELVARTGPPLRDEALVVLS